MKLSKLFLFCLVIIFFLSCNSKTAEEYLFDGLKRSEHNDLKGAIEFYNKAIKIKPDYAEAYKQRGCAKFNMKDILGSVDDLSEAIKYNNEYAEAYYNRGTVYVYLEDMEKACKDFKKAKELKFPNIDDSYKMCK